MKEGKLKKIFITGGTGLLGHCLAKTAPNIYDINCTFFPKDKENAIIYDCTKHYLDIADRAEVLSVIKKIKPDYVIHTASIANVDYAEKNQIHAKSTNLGGTLNIIEACMKINAKLIYISSNAVFDGKNPPYAENSPVNPLNFYGELKVAEEDALKKSGLKYAIIRAILMYGWNLDVERKNPVTWLIDLLKLGKEVHIVDDVFSNPLFVEDCTDTIWKILESEKQGVFHVAGKDEISRYEFACAVAEVFGFDKGLIKPVKSTFFTSIAKRPMNTTYCIDKIKKELEIFPCGIHKGLNKMKKAGYETA